MKSNKGITLVALIITVIILLILSAISIDIAIDGKLFDRSKETVSEANNKLGEEQNRVDSLVNEWDNLETGTSGNTSGNEPEDTTPPTVEVEIERTTSNSITINVTATDNESGMIETPTYTYYIKKSTESTYEEKASNNTSSHIFTDLTQETTYDIKVEVAGDNAGNTGTGTAQATTKKVTSGLEQGAITFGSTTWSSNKASITVSTNTSYTIEYQVNSIVGTWTTIANGGTVTGLKHGDTVYARLTDGINHGNHASASIKDGTAPTISSFTVTAYDTTSITVSASATDNQSGIYSYQFQYKLSTSSSYTTAKTTVTSSETCTYKYTGLSDGTTYNLRVAVTDKAGKTSNKTANQTTEKVEPEGVPESESYVGYYADVDGDKQPDGIIYVDLADTEHTNGSWNNDIVGWSDYEYTPVTEGLKQYEVCNESYTGFGNQWTKPVLTAIEGSEGADRFYVMALEDFNDGNGPDYCWYDDAYGNLKDIISANYNDFGEGKQNTIVMIANWNSSGYGAQNANVRYFDMWGVIQTAVGNISDPTWFVPSKAEWAAFGDFAYTKMGVDTGNYENYGLQKYYWSSAQQNTNRAYGPYFDKGYIDGNYVNRNISVRLSATF